MKNWVLAVGLTVLLVIFNFEQAHACNWPTPPGAPSCPAGYTLYNLTWSTIGADWQCCTTSACGGSSYGTGGDFTCGNGFAGIATGGGGNGNENGSGGMPGGCSPTSPGSIIRADLQVLHEVIPIVGTPFSLVYSSDKVPGNLTWYTAHVPLTSGSITGSLTDVYATLSIPTNQAGCSPTTTFTYNDSSPTNNNSWNYTWNGLDSCSNNTVGQVFQATTTILETNSPTKPNEISYPSQIYLGTSYVNSLANAGWEMNVIHHYDSVRGVLYKGDGTSYSAKSFTDPTYSGYTIVMSQDGSEAYLFSGGQHVYTKTGLLGTTKYSFTYSSGVLSTIVDAYGNTTTFNYTSGHLSSISAPFGQSTSVTVDSNGFINSVTNPNSETYTITNYTGGLLETFEKPAGTTSTMTYDSIGRLTADSSTAGSSDSLGLTYTSTTGWTVTETNALSQQKTHAASDYIPYTRTDTDPAGYYSTFTNTPPGYSGARSEVQDVFSYSRSYTPTNDARLGSAFNFMNAMTVYQNAYSSSYSATQSATLGTSGDPFSVTAYGENYTLNGKNSSLAWSSSTNKYTFTSPVGRYFYRTIDSNERTISTQLASLTPFTYTYDSNGRLSEIQQGSSRTTNFAYYSTGASNGMLYTVTDPLLNVTTLAYDNAGRITTRTLPDSRSINYTYDSDGNLSTVTPPGRSAHTLNYNGFDKLSSYVTPNLTLYVKEKAESAKRLINKIQDKLAKWVGKISPKLSSPLAHPLFTSYTTSYTYNDNRQLTTITRPDTSTVAFNYNSSTGVLSSIVIPTGTNSYTFSYGKRPSYNSSLDHILQYFTWQGYLFAGNTVYYNSAYTRYSNLYLNYNNGFTLANDQVSSNGTSSGPTIDYSYDNDNLLTAAGSATLTRASATGFVTKVAVGSNAAVNLSYDSSYGELSEVQGDYSSTVDYEEDITRDNVGRVSSRTETYTGTGHTYAYTYDAAGRLTTVTKDSGAYESYSYDDNSNITSQTVSGTTTTGVYDSLDRVETFGTKTYTFSTSGELESIYDSSTSGTTSYTYDVLGNLKSVTLPSSTVLTYTVDANNRRTSKSTSSTVDNYFVWGSGHQLLALMNASGVVTARFVFGSRKNIPDYMIDSSGNTYLIVSNHLGSPVQVIATSSGTVEEQITYDDFGNILSDSNPGFQPFGFAGCLYDQDTKLCHFGGGEISTQWNGSNYNAGRDYDASTGRWTNRDMILFKGGNTNLYGYVLNDPVNKVDPTGRMGIAPIAVDTAIDVAEWIGEQCLEHQDVCSTAVNEWWQQWLRRNDPPPPTDPLSIPNPACDPYTCCPGGVI